MQNFDIDRLYLITREGERLKAHTGYYSYATPKLYRLGDANRVCNDKNRRHDEWINSPPYDYSHLAKVNPKYYTPEKIEQMNENQRKNKEAARAQGRYVVRSVREFLNRMA